VTDVAQTVLGAGTSHVLVLAPPGVLDPQALTARTKDLAARDTGPEDTAVVPEIVVVPAADDVHLVTAVTAVASTIDATGPGIAVPDVPSTVRRMLDLLESGRTTATEAPALLVRLLEECADPGIVAILPDVDVPAETTRSLVADVERLVPDADVVVLPTGRAGDGVGIGVEPAEGAERHPVSEWQGGEAS
jgi:hypothetical protein